MDRLKGKIAIVVGAGSIGPGWGNGKATAVTFAREGAQVFCVDRNGTAAEETANIIASEGGKAGAFTADVSRAGEVEAMVAACLKAHGRIDVLDNNVGIAEMGSVVEVAEADWDRVFAVNLKSAFLAMKHVIPVMARQGGGSIINISSIASIRHLGISYVTYATTKAAMNQMTRTTAVEYAPKNIRVNAILPGLMKTPMVEHSAGLAASYAKGDVKGDAKGDVKGGDVEAMWRARDAQVPMGHMGDAWDVANAALFLASDESKYVTGLELVVDGGITLKVS
jgi:NAD(P)-dependent dehydrogenase (short-subunit alcohol dehydrogenase family)